MESKIHMKFEDQIEESFMIDRPVGIFGANESFHLVEIVAIKKNVLVFFKRRDVNSQMCLLQFWDWSNFKDNTNTQDGVLEISSDIPRGSLESLFAEIITREISLPRFNFRRHVIQPISMMGSILLSVEKDSLVKRSFWS